MQSASRLKSFFQSVFKLSFSVSVLLFLWGSLSVQESYAQPETLEAAVGSVGDATALGPATSVSFDLLRNADNPAGNTFSTYLPQTTVTITLDNFNTTFNPLQSGNTNPVSFGWFVNTVDTAEPDYIDNTYLVNGDEDLLFTGLDYISDPADGNYTATDAGNTGEGIDVSVNHGAFLVASLSGLQNQPLLDGGGVPIDYELADLTISFSEPLTNPVIHLMGLGAEWVASITQDAVTENYRNSATVEFDLIDAEINFVDQTAGDVTLSVLSGSVLMAIEDTDKIVNTSDDPSNRFDYDGPDGGSGDGSTDGDGAAHGSVLVTGEDITGLTFRVFVRSGTGGLDGAGADEGFGWAGNNSAWTFDPGTGAESVYYEVDAGGDPVVTSGELNLLLEPDTDANDELLQYYFAEDAFMISVSAELEADETELNGDECFRMLSSPVDGTTYSTLLDPIWTQGMTGADFSGGDPNVWLWPTNINDADSDAGDWNPPSDLTNTIPPGSGFLVSVFDDDDYDNIGDGFPKILTVTGSENAPLTFTSMNSTADGWTMLGNPFKSTIDWDLLIGEAGTSDIDDAVYVYDRSTSSYVSYSSVGGGDLTDGLIAPFQGFFVQNLNTGSQVDFTDAVKSSTDGTFFGKEKELQNFARFELNGESLYNSMWIHFSNEGAVERIRGDALELQPLASEYAMLGTRKADGTIFDIGHYPIPDEEFEIPVSLETTRSGIFTITATDFDLSIGSDLYFIDLQEQESIRIDENFSYEFSTSGIAAKTPGGAPADRCSVEGPQKAKTIAASDRFLIATQPRDFVEIPNALALNQNYPNPFNPTTQIKYELPQQSDVRLEVYDLVGRQVATLVNQTVEAGAHTVNFDASNLSSGVYIYRLNAGSQVLSRKLTVIK